MAYSLRSRSASIKPNPETLQAKPAPAAPKSPKAQAPRKASPAKAKAAPKAVAKAAPAKAAPPKAAPAKAKAARATASAPKSPKNNKKPAPKAVATAKANTSNRPSKNALPGNTPSAANDGNGNMMPASASAKRMPEMMGSSLPAKKAKMNLPAEESNDTDLANLQESPANNCNSQDDWKLKGVDATKDTGNNDNNDVPFSWETEKKLNNHMRFDALENEADKCDPVQNRADELGHKEPSMDMPEVKLETKADSWDAFEDLDKAVTKDELDELENEFNLKDSDLNDCPKNCQEKAEPAVNQPTVLDMPKECKLEEECNNNNINNINNNNPSKTESAPCNAASNSKSFFFGQTNNCPVNKPLSNAVAPYHASTTPFTYGFSGNISSCADKPLNYTATGFFQSVSSPLEKLCNLTNNKCNSIEGAPVSAGTLNALPLVVPSYPLKAPKSPALSETNRDEILDQQPQNSTIKTIILGGQADDFSAAI